MNNNNLFINTLNYFLKKQCVFIQLYFIRELKSWEIINLSFLLHTWMFHIFYIGHDSNNFILTIQWLKLNLLMIEKYIWNIKNNKKIIVSIVIFSIWCFTIKNFNWILIQDYISQRILMSLCSSYIDLHRAFDLNDGFDKFIHCLWQYVEATYLNSHLMYSY